MQLASDALEHTTMALTLSGVDVEIACLRRRGSKPPLLCLHGFGSTKEDYADMALYPGFAGRDLVFLDALGSGHSRCSDPRAVSIAFLRDITVMAADHLGLDRFHLSGHSMGGLTGLMLAAQFPERVLSFANIEGNIAPEDCFLSRQIISHPADSAEGFLADFISRNRLSATWSARLYAAALTLKISAGYVDPIFRSMVDLSDNTPLMGMFGGLLMPKMFVYGAQNNTLSYLGKLPELGVELAEIPYSAHFPMYSNPPALWSCLADFTARCDPPYHERGSP